MALRFVDERQGALCRALIGHNHGRPSSDSLHAPCVRLNAEDEQEPPWSTANLESTQSDAWVESAEWQDTPLDVLELLRAHREVFAETLPTGLPPKRPHDHHILLVSGRLPAKSAIYRMTPDQLHYHKQEIAELSTNGRIGPTYSPICYPTMMADKRNDGSGARKTRMVANYQALNAPTVAPDFPLLPIQTILKMMGGAKYFSTLDLKAESQQILISKENR